MKRLIVDNVEYRFLEIGEVVRLGDASFFLGHFKIVGLRGIGYKVRKQTLGGYLRPTKAYREPEEVVTHRKLEI